MNSLLPVSLDNDSDRPSASKRMREEHAPGPNWERHPQLYLSDGTAVVLCETTLFRVSSGVLAINSVIFQDMFALPAVAPLDMELYDGVPLVRLPDSAIDMEYFLKALFVASFIPPAFKNLPWPVLSAVLRLSNKYFVEGLRRRMVHRLRSLIPVHLADYNPSITDEFQECAEKPGTSTYLPHVLDAISLCRECDVAECLPGLSYMAVRDNMQALTCPESSQAFKTNPALVLADVLALSKGAAEMQMYDHRLVSKALSKEAKACTCSTDWWGGMSFGDARADSTASVLKRALDGRGLDPPHYMDRFMMEMFCQACQDDWKKKLLVKQVELWKQLPSFFGLAPWEELLKEDEEQ